MTAEEFRSEADQLALKIVAVLKEYEQTHSVEPLGVTMCALSHVLSSIVAQTVDGPEHLEAAIEIFVGSTRRRFLEGNTL